jgi:integrase
MLLEAGEDLEIVSKRLGHSSIYITAMTYSHVLEKRKAKSVALIDKVL